MTALVKVKTSQRTARTVGALFLIAMAASLVGGVGYLESLLGAPDYITAVSENESQVMIGVLLELINGIAVVGIGVLMFPFLRIQNEGTARGYLAFRVLESVFICVAAIIPLSLVTLSQAYVSAGGAGAAYFEILGTLIIGARADVADLLIPAFFSLGALLLYYSLYRSRLVPRFLSVWGLIAAVLIIILNLVLISDLVEIPMAFGLLLALPIMLNEIFLGIWLIVKGFDVSAISSEFV